MKSAAFMPMSFALALIFSLFALVFSAFLPISFVLTLVFRGFILTFRAFIVVLGAFGLVSCVFS